MKKAGRARKAVQPLQGIAAPGRAASARLSRALGRRMRVARLDSLARESGIGIASISHRYPVPTG
jgi:hypothetical protein